MNFYKNKRVFVTGHTGFKGTWMCKVLINSGAIVTGYALKPTSNPSLYQISNLDGKMKSIIGDIRDYDNLKKSIISANPEIVIHMAAQPLVIESYNKPVYTYETNVMGTVHLLDAVRVCSSVKSVLNVTTDKVYKNLERESGYTEDETLDGYDPYSNSKSCSELVTNSFRKSFYFKKNIALSTVRSGNVIGGGDFSENRIIPDCIKAATNNEEIIIRNPNSIRPYQHVLEPIMAYLLIAKKQYENYNYQGSYNVGPYEDDCITTEKLVNVFCEKWGGNIKWITTEAKGFHESGCLKLNCTKIFNTFGWKPHWNIEKAIEMTVEWMKVYNSKGAIELCMDNQIIKYLL